MFTIHRLYSNKPIQKIVVNNAIHIANHGKKYFRTSSEKYDQTHTESLDQSQEFWTKQASKLTWFEPFHTAFDGSDAPLNKWFVGGKTNICYDCVDRHVLEGRGNHEAIAYESPVSGVSSVLTYEDLLKQVSKFAGVLKSYGVTKGDRIVIYCPMIPEAVISMLACARLGAIHSVVFGGFSSKELATRIDHALPKVIITASHGFEPGRVVPYEPLLSGALELSKHKPTTVIVKDRHVHQDGPLERKHNWIDYEETMQNPAILPEDYVLVESNDPLYILYTSGTTGQPKGVLRDTGGYATALRYSMEHFMNMTPNKPETYWAASDIGWVVGHSFCVYGPLLNGNKSILFEGKPVGTPDAGVYWRLIEKHQVQAMFTSPTALRVVRKFDPHLEFLQGCDISSLKTLFIAGERGDPETMKFFTNGLQVPVVDHWWQTETGWPICGIQTNGSKFGSSSKPLPGYDVQILDENSKPLEANKLGDIVVKLPLPPGTLMSLYKGEEQYVKNYLTQHPGYYNTGDAGFKDEDGYVHIMSRTDDVINTAGHRLSTGAIEEVLISHPLVADCAVVGLADPIKHEVPLGFLVLTNDALHADKDQLRKEIIQSVRDDIGPVAVFKKIIIVQALPKTRSGKTLRNALHKLVNDEEYVLPGTVENPEVMIGIEQMVLESKSS